MDSVSRTGTQTTTTSQTTAPATPRTSAERSSIHAAPADVNAGSVKRLAMLFEGFSKGSTDLKRSSLRDVRPSGSLDLGGELPMPNGSVIVASRRVRAISETGTAATTSQARLRDEGLSELQAADKPTVGSPEKGRVIGDTFQHNGQTIAEEVATRTDTVSGAIKSLTDRKKFIEEQLKERPYDPKLRRQYSMTIKQLVQAQEIKESGGTWAGSSSYRNHVKNSSSLQKAHDTYVPLVVNHRIQKVKNAAGKVISSLNRSGAIHDYRHGHTNLQDLRQMHIIIGQRGMPDPGQREVLNQLDPKITDALLQGDFGQAKKLLEGHITDRQLILENQALQDISAHFEGMDPKELENLPNEVLFGRVSMLNGFNPPKKMEGFDLNERNQMLDMAAIYGDLQGKTLIFDGKGPYVDDKGQIHMPVKAGPDDAPVTRSFKPIYFNISAQGNIKNEGPQKEINRQAYLSLAGRVTERCDQLERIGTPEAKAKAKEMRNQLLYIGTEFEKGVTDGFELAEQTALLLQNMEAKLSINCFSGKDRTGLLAALVTFKHVKDGLGKVNPPLGSRRMLAALGNFGRQLMSVAGTASRVVEDNTKFTALKLSVFEIKLLNVGTRRQKLAGIATRLNELRAAGATFFVKGTGEIGTGHV